MTHHVVQQLRAIRIRGPIDGGERLDNVNERVISSAKGEIDEVEGDHPFNGRFRGP